MGISTDDLFDKGLIEVSEEGAFRGDYHDYELTEEGLATLAALDAFRDIQDEEEVNGHLQAYVGAAVVYHEGRGEVLLVNLKVIGAVDAQDAEVKGGDKLAADYCSGDGWTIPLINVEAFPVWVSIQEVLS